MVSDARRRRRKRDRIVEVLRRHEEVGGDWSYDADTNEWVRADGVRVYGRSHCTITAGGSEEYYTRWYVAFPVHGPTRELGRSYWDDSEWLARELGRLPDYVEPLWIFL